MGYCYSVGCESREEKKQETQAGKKGEVTILITASERKRKKQGVAMRSLGGLQKS